jgi:hypothetical protein
MSQQTEQASFSVMEESVEGWWSPARVYLLVSGIYLVVFAGVVGFMYTRSFALGAQVRTDPNASARVLGIFVSNGWHNLLGVAGGVIALALVKSSPRTTRAAALWLGAYYLAVTVSLMVPASNDLAANIIATNGADNFVHAALGVGGIFAGLVTRRTISPVESPAFRAQHQAP